MAHELSPLTATLNYRSIPYYKRHRFLIALIFSLPGLSLWTTLLLVFLGHFYGRTLFLLWLAATACAIGSLAYYDGLASRQPKPWFVEICLAINIFTLIVCIFVGGILAIPECLWFLHLLPRGPL